MRGFCVISITMCLSVAACAQSAADPLIQAIRNNDLNSLKASLAKGADVNTKDARGSTLLMHAAAVGSPEAVKLLLDSGADVNAKNEVEATALILGAGNAEKARMLVEKGADVNAHSKLGRTPLMIAAGCDGCTATVKLLLDKGADPNAKDKQGNTAAGSRFLGRHFGQRQIAAGQGRGRRCRRQPGLHAALQCREQLQSGGGETLSLEGGERQRAEYQGRRSEVRQDSTHQIDAVDDGIYFLRAGCSQGPARRGRQGE